MMDELIRVRAKIKLFEGDNMRRTPFRSAYRPIFSFSGARTNISGRIDLIGMDSFAPGTSDIVQVAFIKGMISDIYFKPGEVFTISEGGKYILGEGEILEVINDKEMSSH